MKDVFRDELDRLVHRTPFSPSATGIDLDLTFEDVKRHRDLLATPAVPSQFRLGLENVLLNGYQPRYNGRPSCPFCANFVDAEETHAADCLLVQYLMP